MPPTVLRTTELHTPIAQFSHGVRFDGYVLVGGKGATDPRSTATDQRSAVLGAGVSVVAGQTAQMFKTVGTVLRLLDSGFDRLVQMRVYLTDWRFREVFEEAYELACGTNRPATAYVQSLSFAIPDLLLEIDVIAADGGKEKQTVALNDGQRAGIRVGETFYSDGLLGRLTRPDHFLTDATVQSESALAALQTALDRAGLTPAHASRVTVTLADPRDIPTFLDVWRRTLPAPRPPCVLVCAGLPDPRARVQVEVIAHDNGVQRVTFADLGSRDPELAGESAAARAGSMVWTSSMPFRSFGALPFSPDAESATDQALDGMFSALGPLGAGPADLLRVGVAVPDWRLYRSMNIAYGQRVSAPYPARSAIEALPAGHHQPIQLEAVAGVGARDRALLLAPPEYAPVIPREG